MLKVIPEMEAWLGKLQRNDERFYQGHFYFPLHVALVMLFHCNNGKVFNILGIQLSDSILASHTEIYMS